MTSKYCRYCFQNETIWGNAAVMHPKDADGTMNSVDPDQTAPWEQSDLV